jgi:hypothetical protein
MAQRIAAPSPTRGRHTAEHARQRGGRAAATVDRATISPGRRRLRPGRPPTPLTRRRQRSPTSVLLVAAFGAFLAFLDSTIVNIAFPADLGYDADRNGPRAEEDSVSGPFEKLPPDVAEYDRIFLRAIPAIPASPACKSSAHQANWRQSPPSRLPRRELFDLDLSARLLGGHPQHRFSHRYDGRPICPIGTA